MGKPFSPVRRADPPLPHPGYLPGDRRAWPPAAGPVVAGRRLPA